GTVGRANVDCRSWVIETQLPGEPAVGRSGTGRNTPQRVPDPTLQVGASCGRWQRVDRTQLARKISGDGQRDLRRHRSLGQYGAAAVMLPQATTQVCLVSAEIERTDIAFSVGDEQEITQRRPQTAQ